MQLAGQLAQGVNFDHILDNIRDEIQNKFYTIHLITRKDLANIERSYGLKGIERHRNDAISVKAWVEEMKKDDNNPVLYCINHKEIRAYWFKQPRLCSSDTNTITGRYIENISWYRMCG